MLPLGTIKPEERRENPIIVMLLRLYRAHSPGLGGCASVAREGRVRTSDIPPISDLTGFPAPLLAGVLFLGFLRDPTGISDLATHPESGQFSEQIDKRQQ